MKVNFSAIAIFVVADLGMLSPVSALAMENANKLSASAPPVAASASATVHICEPLDRAARRIGNVTFTLDGDNLTFANPITWQVPVQMKERDPPGDPPSLTLRWTSSEGQTFFGMITWHDDATIDGPSNFGIMLKVSGNETKWARWSCKFA